MPPTGLSVSRQLICESSSTIDPLPSCPIGRDLSSNHWLVALDKNWNDPIFCQRRVPPIKNRFCSYAWKWSSPSTRRSAHLPNFMSFYSILLKRRALCQATSLFLEKFKIVSKSLFLLCRRAAWIQWQILTDEQRTETLSKREIRFCPIEICSLCKMMKNDLFRWEWIDWMSARATQRQTTDPMIRVLIDTPVYLKCSSQSMDRLVVVTRWEEETTPGHSFRHQSNRLTSNNE